MVMLTNQLFEAEESEKILQFLLFNKYILIMQVTSIKSAHRCLKKVFFCFKLSFVIVRHSSAEPQFLCT